MTTKVKGKGGNGVVERALELGMQRADQPLPDFTVRLSLTRAQRDMLMSLCAIFDLSTRAALNAALRYALHVAALRGTSVDKLPEYPKRLSGKKTDFELTADTRAKVRDAGLLDSLAACTIAGLKLLNANALGVLDPK